MKVRFLARWLARAQAMLTAAALAEEGDVETARRFAGRPLTRGARRERPGAPSPR
jgi:hypothetical protein